MGKSAAKIRRNQARAAARGESYAPPPPTTTTTLDDSQNAAAADDEDDSDALRKCAAAQKLKHALIEIEKNADGRNSKERRAAKRKAEAIAAEEAGCPADQLSEWYAHRAKEGRSAKRKADAVAARLARSDDGDDAKSKHKADPYILFVGQLSYATTSDALFRHFRQTLGPAVIRNDSVKIRLLTDANTQKSKGMAFVELSTPETMYECLKMHLTHLDGRRINVERSSGGGNAAKKSKITNFRREQSSFISETVDKILEEHVKIGEIEEGELDQGVIALCKRHSAAVVEQALREYVEEKRVRKERKEKWGEKEEEEFRNPSAFLTHVIGRVAEEGGALGQKAKDNDKGRSEKGRNRTTDKAGGDGRGHSVLEKSGVDMSISYNKSSDGKNKIASIFPSMQRGRGRGRGYMY